MKRILTAITLILFCTSIMAQEKTKIKLQYFNANNFQVLVGENNGFGIETIHGIKLKNNFAIGLGLGYDTYQLASVPLFIDVRKNWGKGKIKPFVYADAGFNFSLHNDEYPKKWSWSNTDAYNFEQSSYTAFGVGITRAITNECRFTASIGISTKQLKYNYNYAYWGWNEVYNPQFRYDFKFQRYVLKLGIEF